MHASVGHLAHPSDVAKAVADRLEKPILLVLAVSRAILTHLERVPALAIELEHAVC